MRVASPVLCVLLVLLSPAATAAEVTRPPEQIVSWLRDYQASGWWYADSTHRHAVDAIMAGGLGMQSMTWSAAGKACVLDFTTVEGLLWPGYHVRMDFGQSTRVLKSDLVFDEADDRDMRALKVGAGAPNYYVAVEGACVTEVPRGKTTPTACKDVKLIVERDTAVERDRVHAALVDLTAACLARGRSTISPNLY